MLHQRPSGVYILKKFKFSEPTSANFACVFINLVAWNYEEDNAFN